jgi:hypothetical protein
MSHEIAVMICRGKLYCRERSLVTLCLVSGEIMALISGTPASFECHLGSQFSDA